MLTIKTLLAATVSRTNDCACPGLKACGSAGVVAYGASRQAIGQGQQELTNLEEARWWPCSRSAGVYSLK